MSNKIKKEIEEIIRIIKTNTYNEELADQYIRELLDQDKFYE